jgi:ABC-type sugar transport system ATPase subunit
MVGRPVTVEYPRVEKQIGAVRLEVDQIARPPRIQATSLNIRRGEILGLTGLVGSGRTELARLLFGADRATSGSIKLDGKSLRIRSPREAIDAGICLLTEDRKHQGLVLGASVLDNFSLPNLRHLSTAGIVQRRTEREHFRTLTDRLRIRLPGISNPVSQLSGGNQQKVVLAKWLERNAEVLIFDEPTRGIDVGAKHELYLLLGDLARQGKSILMISSDLPEVLGLADRILVMRNGRLAGELPDPRASTQEQIMQLAVA